MTIVRSHQRGFAVKPIIVGVDGSEASIAALREGARIAASRRVHLEAIAAWDDCDGTGYDGAGRMQLGRVAATKGLQCVARIVFEGPSAARFRAYVDLGTALRVLRRASRGAQMLVVGGRAEGSGTMLGAVTASCATFAECSVLIVHHVSAYRSRTADLV